MKLKLLLLAALSLPICAAGTDGVLFPYGPWFVCTSPVRFLLADQSPCDSLIGGTEQYTLNLRTDVSSTTRYDYTIVATVEGIDAPVTVFGTLKRKDNAAGWSSAVVQFGGVVTKYKISVQCLGIVSESIDIQRSVK